MLCQFAWSHWDGDIKKDLVTNHFNIANDCVKALSNQLGAALFRSGSVAPAPVALATVIGSADGLTFGSEYPMPLNRLGRVVRLGAVIGDGTGDPLEQLPAGTVALIDTGDNFPEDHGRFPVLDARKERADYLAALKALHVVPDELIDPETGRFDAAGGQIFSNTRKLTFSVHTPVCEAFVLPAGEEGAGEFWSVKNLRGRGVFAALSRDGKPLAESRRILLFHLTDTQAFKAEFSSPGMNRILRWGELPHMAAAGEAEILLPGGEGVELYALDTAGNRLEHVALSPHGNRTAARLRVFNSFGQTMLYELIRKCPFEMKKRRPRMALFSRESVFDLDSGDLIGPALALDGSLEYDSQITDFRRDRLRIAHDVVIEFGLADELELQGERGEVQVVGRAFQRVVEIQIPAAVFVPEVAVGFHRSKPGVVPGAGGPDRITCRRIGVLRQKMFIDFQPELAAAENSWALVLSTVMNFELESGRKSASSFRFWLLNRSFSGFSRRNGVSRPA